MDSWSLRLYGTSTPPAVDYSREKDMTMPEMPPEDFSQNSIDDSIRSSTKESEVGFWFLWWE